MNSGEKRPLWKRVGWLVGLYMASITILGLVALAIKFWLGS
ncbi:DUF2474 domain-containing protein [Pacificimonas flava]|uniref:DUF2474 domain-containing protein n=2 Tax=Pacificimonas TaxID=1960290 RepID=A0A219B4I2_9SPHN|nr:MULTISPECIES: DUF2474 family protein [Pacificimonas]MBZ6379520.1 DUF2474 family protein [Pacificimonas aurantium]OWV33292.1 DUF2474 domain-containing protein [Pacificimonas flava]